MIGGGGVKHAVFETLCLVAGFVAACGVGPPLVDCFEEPVCKFGDVFLILLVEGVCPGYSFFGGAVVGGVLSFRSSGVFGEESFQGGASGGV